MGLTVEGVPMNAMQQKQAEILLGVVNQLQAGSICAEAIICAAIGESTLTNLSQPNGSGYWGVLQGGSGYSGSTANFPPPTGWNDSVGMATAFLQGGKGFGNGWTALGYPQLQGKGAIAAVRAGVTDPGTIAEGCEDSGSAPSFYGQHLPDAKSIIAAYGGSTLKGGIAGSGSGGTGTILDGSKATTYPFQIGSTANPDEDIWTGINRLAQEVNWYLFTNGEVLYYMDGAEMIAQSPALYLDRVDDSARFASPVQGNFDDTAFQYVSTHKRKFRVQRRTKLAQITSPTQVRLDLICGIDEIRAGDVIVLTSFGPLDGRWIVADCTRSVFAVSSQITLVPPIAPLTEAAVAATTGKASNTAGKLNLQAVGGYVNPLSQIQNLRPERIDMGVDYAGSGNLLALGDAKIFAAASTGAGWPRYTFGDGLGGFVGYTLSNGAYAGKHVYVAENIDPLVHTNDTVKAGDPIAVLHDSGENMETGWAGGLGAQTLAALLHQQAPGLDPGAWTSAAGASFNRLLVRLGAPSGIMQAGGVHGTMPNGYS